VAESTKRIRRTPEEAKRLILDAAEASMGAAGPAGIRLVQIAERAGVSHPTVLHHFGSREGLIQALNRRALEELRKGVLGSIRAPEGDEDGVTLTFQTYRNGLAQRLIWMLQVEGQEAPARLEIFEEIVRELHALRVRLAEPGVVVDEQDTRSIVHLTAVSAFGDAIIGPRLRGAAGVAEEAAQRGRFERWLGLLLNAHITKAISE